MNHNTRDQAAGPWWQHPPSEAQRPEIRELKQALIAQARYFPEGLYPDELTKHDAENEKKTRATLHKIADRLQGAELCAVCDIAGDLLRTAGDITGLLDWTGAAILALYVQATPWQQDQMWKLLHEQEAEHEAETSGRLLADTLGANWEFDR